MKKFLLTFMTISLSFLLLGCGTTTEQEKETDSSNKVEETTDKVTEPETDEITEPDKEQDITEPDTESEEGEKEPVSEDVTLEDEESEEEPAEEKEPVAEEPKSFTHGFEGKYWVEVGEWGTCGYYYDGTHEINVYENGDKFVRPYTVEDGRLVITYNSGYTGKLDYSLGEETFTVYPDEGSMEISCFAVDKERFEEIFGKNVLELDEEPKAEEKEPEKEEPEAEEKESEKEEPKAEEKEPVKEESKTEEKEPVTDKPATEEKDPVAEEPATEENKPATEENKPVVKNYQYAFEGKYWYEEVDYMTYDGVRYSSVVNFYDGTAERGFYKTNEYYRMPYSVVNDCIVYDYGDSFYYSIEGNIMTLSSTNDSWVRHMVLLGEAEITDVLSKNVIEDQPAEDEFVGDRPVGFVYEFEETYWVEYDQNGEVVGYYYDGTNETVYRGEESSTRSYSVMGNDIVFMEDDFYLAYYYMLAGDSLILTPNDGSMPRHCSRVDKAEFDRLLRGEELPEEEPKEEPGEEPDEEETTVEIPSTEGKNFTHEFEGKYWLEYLPNEKAMGHFFDGSKHITIYAGEKSTQPYTVKDNRMVYTYDWGTFEVTYYVTTEDEGNYITLYPSDGSMEAYYKEVTKEEFEKLCK